MCASLLHLRLLVARRGSCAAAVYSGDQSDMAMAWYRHRRHPSLFFFGVAAPLMVVVFFQPTIFVAAECLHYTLCKYVSSHLPILLDLIYAFFVYLTMDRIVVHYYVHCLRLITHLFIAKYFVDMSY